MPRDPPATTSIQTNTEHRLFLSTDTFREWQIPNFISEINLDATLGEA